MIVVGKFYCIWVFVMVIFGVMLILFVGCGCGVSC